MLHVKSDFSPIVQGVTKRLLHIKNLCVLLNYMELIRTYNGNLIIYFL